MKLPAICLAFVLSSSTCFAAVNTGLPQRGALPDSQVEPDRKNPYGDMAVIDRLLEDQRYAEAIPVLERFLTKNGVEEHHRSIGYNLKGLSLFMVGRLAEAIADFTKSLELQERAAVAAVARWKTVFNRGLAYEAANDLARAADDFVRAYAMAPNERRVKSKIYRFFNKE
tara:strand:+ start:533 stop:1042 length:510 start_codon:yes stop_codon:yes gene_type:complete